MEENLEKTLNAPGKLPESDAQQPVSGSQVDGEQVVYKSGFAVGVATEKDITINGGGAFGIAAGRDMQLTNGGAVKIAVGRDLYLSDSGTGLQVVKGSSEITDSITGASICNEVNAKGSIIGVLISRNATLGEGSNVLLGTKQAAVFGAVFGAIFALVSWLLRKMK